MYADQKIGIAQGGTTHNKSLDFKFKFKFMQIAG